jgi:transposase InsO family protein
MQEESSSHPSSGAEGQAARGESARPPAGPHTSADQHEYLRERAEALNRPSAFNERAAANVPLDGPVQDEEVLNDLVEDALTPGPEMDDEAISPRRFMAGRRKGSAVKGKKLVKPEDAGRPMLTAQQRLLLLDTWRRSGLPAGDFATLVKIGKHTLYAWKKAFDEQGPAGLMDKPRGGPRGMKLPELTRRTILMLKESNPSWGCQRISDMLLRGPALPACPATVSKVLHEAGYQMVNESTQRHPDKVRSFERARPNQLWQSDLFTFILKRQNRRVYLVAFMDDHSRFIVSYGLHASQSAALVLECLRAGISSYGSPQEVLTDNGSQYITWRGKSAFSRELEKRGIQHVVASPRRPQTLGKVERFWGTLWRECLETSVFLDMTDAQKRIGLFIDYYNFQRPHQGLGTEGLVPADRFFGAAPDVLRTLKERVASNALELARNGTPKTPFYLTGSVGGKGFSVHAEGERVILTRQEGEREEVDLTPPVPPVVPEPALQPEPELPHPVCPQGVVDSELNEAENLPEPEPGTSPLDEHFPPTQAGGLE